MDPRVAYTSKKENNKSEKSMGNRYKMVLQN